jgi:NAD(P)-dependent dehydrogenase (short-subunit alcohol dehydrogenase family)
VKRLDSPNADGKAGDVRDEEGFTKLLISLAPLDHVIFSGVDKIIRGSLADADLDEAKHLFGVKFWGSVVIGKGTFVLFLLQLKGLTQIALLKHDIVKPGGSLTLTSGGAAFRPGKGAAIGGALNGGILVLTKGLASELVEKRIRVNTVVPGLVQTELWDKLGKTKDEQKQTFEESSKKLSVGFVATPEHIAEAYLYTVRADYANGTLVVIGVSMNLNIISTNSFCRWRSAAMILSLADFVASEHMSREIFGENKLLHRLSPSLGDSLDLRPLKPGLNITRAKPKLCEAPEPSPLLLFDNSYYNLT